ncbi:MAG: DUF3971 domain-containing protein, partial [Desulfomonilaceae bacterium]
MIFKKICIVHPVLFLPASQTPSDAFFFKGPQYEVNAWWLKPQIEDFELSQGIIVFQDHSSPGDSYLKKQLTLTGLDVKFHNLNIDSIDSFEIRGRSTESKIEGLFEIKGRFSSQNRLEGGKIARNFSAKFSDCPMKPFLVLAKFFQIEIPISDANFSFVADASFDSSKWIFSGVSIVSGGFLQSNQLIRSRVPIDKIGARFAGEMSDKLLILDLQEISLPGVVASLKIQLKNRFRSNATLEILVSKAEVDIKRASDFLPVSLFQVSERDRLKKADLKGHLQIVNSFWINSLQAVRDGNYRNADMGLDVVLSNVSGIIPGYPLPIKEASGFIRLNTSEILFKGITLSIGNSPVVINGWISNLKTNPTVDLFVSANAVASDMRDALLQEPFCRKFGPILKNFQDAQGSAAITMDVKGPLIDPSLKGLVKLEELQFRIEGLPLPVRKLDGDLRFRGSKVSFSVIKGLIGDSAFELRGDMAQFVWNLDLDLKLTGSDIRKFSSFPVGWNVTGNAPVSLNLKGKSSNFNFNGTVDFSPTTIIYESFIRKKTGTKAKLEFSGTSNQGGISVEEAYLITEAGRVFAKAVFNCDGKTLVLVNLPPKGIPTSSLAPFADPALELQ